MTLKDTNLRKKTGFTLIELLIVIGIIGILSSIAIVNMIDAQTRGRIARAVMDMRTMRTALEAYYIDFDDYPTERYAPGGELAGFALLTTPIDYITSVPIDVFREGMDYTVRRELWYHYMPDVVAPIGGGYLCWGYYNNYERQYDVLFGDPLAGYLAGIADHAPCEYIVRSIGPNRIDSYGVAYDPTNGTISVGDVLQHGGAHPHGAHY